MRDRRLALVVICALLALGLSVLLGPSEGAFGRRYLRGDHTLIGFKNHFFKESLRHIQAEGRPTLADLAMEMNRREGRYPLPYVWGGSIKNSLPGLDCTGFVHGLMYYLGYREYGRRFNTRSLFHALARDPGWLTIYDARQAEAPFDPGTLRPGDLIVWPANVDDGRNLPGPIWGHVGVVSAGGAEPLVTHYVDSEAYNYYDLVGPAGPGLNTIPAREFLRLKQRGILGIFRSRRINDAS